MDAPDGMMFKSAAGSVGITSLKDVTIKSIDGKVCQQMCIIKTQQIKVTYTAVQCRLLLSKTFKGKQGILQENSSLGSLYDTKK